MSARKLMLTTLLSLCVLVSGLSLGSVPAVATIIHPYLAQIGEVPVEGPHKEAVPLPGPLVGADAMTVDEGHLWTVEREKSEQDERVDEFDGASQKFEFQQSWPRTYWEPRGVAVGHATAERELYVGLEERASKQQVVGVFGPTGNLQATWTGADTPAKAFCEPRTCTITSLAADDSKSLSDWAAGDVYVATATGNSNNNAVYILRPQADGKEEYVGQLPGPELGGSFAPSNERHLAVNSANGDVLVAEAAPEAVVDVYEPTAVVGQYALQRTLTGAGSPAGSFSIIEGIAVDPEGDIYVIDARQEGKVIDQFSTEGAYLGHLTGTPKATFGELRSMAVDPVSHDVYVSDFHPEKEAGSVDVFGPGVVAPDVVTGAPSNVKASSATVNGAVDPVQAGPAQCQFAWGTSPSLGKLAPCEPEDVANGNGEVAVHAALNGLRPDTTYYYRLQASNANGTNLGEASQDQEFTTAGPGIQEESASVVTSVSATLGVKIDPNNASTSYYFQYGPSVSYGTDLPAAPGLGLGASKGQVPVSVHLQALAANTTYHYHVVAISEPGGELVTNEGPDRTFTTQAVGAEITLPDGRAWEMVSPPDKQGSGIFALGFEQGDDIQAALDGGGITYGADSPFAVNPAGSRSLEVTQVISSRRAPGSWETADITTAHDESRPAAPAIGQAAEYKLFSSDLSLGLVAPAGHTPLPPLPADAEKTIYFREADGAYKALVTSANVPPGTEFGGNGELGSKFEFVSASPDLSHVVVNAQVALAAGAPSAGGLYEWAAGQLRLISVLPNGELTSHGVLGYHGDEISGVVRNAISADGSRAVWEGEGKAYLRDLVKEETVQIDAAQEGLLETGGGTIYRTASDDDSRVFFTSTKHLTADSTLNPRTEDLYVFEVTSGGGEPLAGRLTDLTAVEAGENADVQGVIGASEDGSYVYFVAGGILGDAAQHGVVGGHYLYEEHYDEATRAWTAPKFIAVLADGDTPTWGNGDTTNLKETTARVSPDGRYLAFMSESSLTGYENRDVSSDVPDEEVFLYDADRGSLICASCKPSGGRPAGLLVGDGFDANLIDYAAIWGDRWLAANIPGWTTTALARSLYQSRYLSDSGRLFFNSSDALVPADVNGKEDVYEYEPEGVGSCQGATHGQSASVIFDEGIGGCVALISSGTSSEESAFMDASETGGDVFFLTLSRLSSQDYDTSIDLYDAHECTASEPCAPQAPLVPPPCTTGDACKPAPTPQPTLFGAPSSETFSGAGNITPQSDASTKSKTTVKSKAKGDVQKLAKALKECRKKPKRKRVGCEGQAKRRHGAKRSRAGKSLSARTRR